MERSAEASMQSIADSAEAFSLKSSGRPLKGSKQGNDRFLIFFLFFFVCFEIGSHYVAQAPLELLIVLPQSPEC
jgi:hypothetical protein